MVSNDWVGRTNVPNDWNHFHGEPRLGPSAEADLQFEKDRLVDIKDMVDTAKRSKELATGGARFDAGKTRVDLIPADILLMLGEIYEMGARKYDASNWRKGMKWSKVYGPLFRHLLKAWSRSGDQRYDEESHKHTHHARGVERHRPRVLHDPS
jgi:hypothetical protein